MQSISNPLNFCGTCRKGQSSRIKRLPQITMDKQRLLATEEALSSGRGFALIPRMLTEETNNPNSISNAMSAWQEGGQLSDVAMLNYHVTPRVSPVKQLTNSDSPNSYARFLPSSPSGMFGALDEASAISGILSLQNRTSDSPLPLPTPPLQQQENQQQATVFPGSQNMFQQPVEPTPIDSNKALFGDDALEKLYTVKKTSHIPRPPNAFMIYRKQKHAEIKARLEQVHAQNGGEGYVSNTEVSRLLGARWRAEPEEIRQRYFQLAKQAELEHRAKYPDYKYQPKRRKTSKKSSVDDAPIDIQRAAPQYINLETLLPPVATSQPSQQHQSLPSIQQQFFYHPTPTSQK